MFGHINHSSGRLDATQPDPGKLCFFVSLLLNFRYIHTPTITTLKGKGESDPNCPTLVDYTGRTAP